MLAIAAALSWAASAVVVKLLDRRHTVDVLSLTAWQSLLGTIPLVVFWTATGSNMPTWSATFIEALAFNVVFGCALAPFLWLYSLRVLPADFAGFGTLAVPVIGVLAAWLQLGEHPSPAEAVGMTLIVAALAMLTASQLMVSELDPGRVLR